MAQFIGENNRLAGMVESLAEGGRCTVRLDSGDRVEAVPVKVAKAGERTLLSVRPERIVINPPKGAKGMSVLEGRIEELIYLGDHVRTRLSVAGHDDFIVKAPNAANAVHLTQGEKARVGWRAEDCRALDPV